MNKQKTIKSASILLAFIAIITLNSFTKSDKTSATTNIYGSVKDEMSTETLVGVEVTLLGTELKTYTDFDGNFTFNNITEGSYVLRAKLVSYKEIKSKKINVKTGDKKVINVKMKITQ